MENHAENKPNNSQMCADAACETRVTLVLWLWTSKSGFKGWNKLQCRGHVESIIFSIFETAITTLSKRPSHVTWVALKQTRRAENVCDMIMHHYVCCSRCYHTFPGDQCTIGLEDLAELQEAYNSDVGTYSTLIPSLDPSTYKSHFAVLLLHSIRWLKGLSTEEFKLWVHQLNSRMMWTCQCNHVVFFKTWMFNWYTMQCCYIKEDRRQQSDSWDHFGEFLCI